MAHDLPGGAPQRHIPLEGGSNLRDIGGYAGADGRTVRWGRIYRSGALFRLTEADWRWISERGVRAVCDLRADQERVLAPTVWRGPAHTRHVGTAYDAARIFAARPDATGQTRALNEMHQHHYTEFADLLAELFRDLFKALVEDETPLIVHCSAGQDRTGLAVGLVLTSLGVPRATIYEDYLLSTAHRRLDNELDRATLADRAHENVVARYYTDSIARHGEAALKPRRLVDAEDQPLLIKAFETIEARWGSLEGYLESELGVGPAEVERLRELYLA